MDHAFFSLSHLFISWSDGVTFASNFLKCGSGQGSEHPGIVIRWNSSGILL